MSQLISELLDQNSPDLIQNLLQSHTDTINQAFCLNTLRNSCIPFLNLGNVVYCPTKQIMLIFKARYLYAYELIKKQSNQEGNAIF